MSENAGTSRNITLITVGVLVIALAAVFLTGLQLAEDEPAAASSVRGEAAAQGIVTTGTGTVSAAPDQLTFTATISYSRATTSAALDVTSSGVRAVSAAAKKAGVDAADITTASISVSPRYRYDRTGRHLVGYGSVQRLEIVTGLKDAGKVLAAVTTAGGNNIRVGGTRLSLSNRDALVDQARTEAVAKAKASAEAIAKAAGREVGELEFVQEVNPQLGEYGLLDAGAPADGVELGSLNAASFRVPVSPGEQDVDVTVQVRWAVAQ